MNKKILIINECGSDNIGDHAINEGGKSIFRDNCIDYDYTTFSTQYKVGTNKPNKPNKPNKVFTRLKSILLKFKPVLYVSWLYKNNSRIKATFTTNYDAVIIGGGQLFLSGFSFPIAMYTWTRWSHRHNIPVYIMGVGCGEKFSLIELILYRSSLKKVENVFVRDVDSIGKISLFFNFTPLLIPDFAFGLHPLTQGSIKSGVVVGMTDYSVYKRYAKEVGINSLVSFQQYLEMWAAKLQSIVKDENEVIYLISTTNRDAVCNEMLLEYLESIGFINTIEHFRIVTSLDEYRAVLSRSRIVFSGRMHSLILGKIESCELIPWVISKKIMSFCDHYSDQSASALRREITKCLTEVM